MVSESQKTNEVTSQMTTSVRMMAGRWYPRIVAELVLYDFSVRSTVCADGVRRRSGCEQYGAMRSLQCRVPRGSTVTAETLRQCKPGSSTVKMVGDNKILTARCKWIRSVSTPAECQKSDDCDGNLCRSYVVCRNKVTPTVVHWNDYTCERDSGFELESTARDGEICHTCENVQDCPGGRHELSMSCVDKINGYSCSRPPGYDERSSAECVCDYNNKITAYQLTSTMLITCP